MISITQIRAMLSTHTRATDEDLTTLRDALVQLEDVVSHLDLTTGGPPAKTSAVLAVVEAALKHREIPEASTDTSRGSSQKLSYTDVLKGRRSPFKRTD